ncbi:MAG TPA: HNH endonuclease signature motif containing protein [Verrucomicrobiae bacterium]|nr:HNH endonuclease signature motif containing protein [Verrucomicrobiae bacterium]
MNLKEVTYLLGWTREKVELAIVDGVKTVKNQLVKLIATKQSADYDIKEEDVDTFLNAFEANEPGRFPPVAVRRELRIESGFQCAICKSDAPPRYHHIIDWANLKHHDPAHMLAICGSCHDKIGVGAIDTKSQIIIKQRLIQQSSKAVAANVESLNSSESAKKPVQAEPGKTESKDAALLEKMGLRGNEFVVVERFHESPANWFHHERFNAAFPGVRGVYEISNPADAVARLSILLKSPLRWVWSVDDGNSAGASPLWWWRGLGNNSIDHYSVVSPNEILLDCDELPIKRVVAVNSGAYWQSFVYIETDPKPPIGIYEKNPESDARMMELFGYLREEYGLYKGRPVTRPEYDDGAAIIDGKPQQIPGAELRVRYITPYNFIIASQESPINNNHFDTRANEILNDILKGKSSVQEFANEMRKLPRRGDFDGYVL